MTEPASGGQGHTSVESQCCWVARASAPSSQQTDGAEERLAGGKEDHLLELGTFKYKSWIWIRGASQGMFLLPKPPACCKRTALLWCHLPRTGAGETDEPGKHREHTSLSERLPGSSPGTDCQSILGRKGNPFQSSSRKDTVLTSHNQPWKKTVAHAASARATGHWYTMGLHKAGGSCALSATGCKWG